MRKKMFALITALLLIVGAIYGCSQKEELNNTESISEGDGGNYYISFGDVEKEVFVQELKDLDIGEDTLMVGVDTDYSEKVVGQLNELLKEEGYEFSVMFCRIPEQYILDRKFTDFSQYLKEQEVGIDVLPVWRSDLKMAVENGLLADISEKIAKAEKLKVAFPEKYWELTSVDGKHYGVGSFSLSTRGWEVNKELMEKYGFTQGELSKEIMELEEVFKRVSEGESDSNFAAFVYEPKYFLDDFIPFEYADVSLPIGYWHEDVSENVVVNIFDTDKMKELVATMNHYYEKGYVKIENNIPWQTSFFMHTDYAGYPIRRSDSLDTWTNFAGIELVRVPYFSQNTNNLAYRINVVASWSEKQGDAWEFLEFVYTNTEVSTLLQYGIEGEDYSMSENVAVAGENLSENVIYNRNLGNMQLAPPISPYEDDSKTVLIEEGLNNLQESFLADFIFDTEPVQKEVDAVRKLSTYLPTFQTMFAFEKTGEYEDWEAFYEAYRNELKAAGIDHIVDEMNRQIQEYLQK